MHPEFGQPTYKALFDRAFEIGGTEVVVYTNGDILYTRNLLETITFVHKVAQQMQKGKECKFMVVGPLIRCAMEVLCYWKNVPRGSNTALVKCPPAHSSEEGEGRAIWCLNRANCKEDRPAPTQAHHWGRVDGVTGAMVGGGRVVSFKPPPGLCVLLCSPR